jgi:DNA-binding response OmpR family regulator
MHVLVCDDDPDVGAFLLTLLQLEGWEARLVTSGEACLEAVDQDEPAAIVLDQMMPGLTGIQTADRLRKNGFTLPIILCSGYLAATLADDIERLDMVPCNKIDFEALTRMVRAALRTARLARRRRAERHA